MGVDFFAVKKFIVASFSGLFPFEQMTCVKSVAKGLNIVLYFEYTVKARLHVSQGTVKNLYLNQNPSNQNLSFKM